MEYYPANIEQKILNSYLQRLTWKLEIIQLGLDTLTNAVAMIHEANPTAALCIPEIDNLQA